MLTVIKNNVRCHDRRRYRKNIHFTKDNKYLGGAKIVVFVVKKLSKQIVAVDRKLANSKWIRGLFYFIF